MVWKNGYMLVESCLKRLIFKTRMHQLCLTSTLVLSWSARARKRQASMALAATCGIIWTRSYSGGTPGMQRISRWRCCLTCHNTLGCWTGLARVGWGGNCFWSHSEYTPNEADSDEMRDNRSRQGSYPGLGWEDWVCREFPIPWFVDNISIDGPGHWQMNGKCI